MILCIFLPMVFAILEMYAMINAVLRRELPNDERQSHGGRNTSQIASGNGINGINYGFFGSFNYDFQHPHKKHYSHPPTAAPSTTTRQPTTSGCPAIVTSEICLPNTGACGSSNECSVNEICCEVSEKAFSCCIQLGATPPTAQYTTTAKQPITTKPNTTGYPSTTTDNYYPWTTGLVGYCPYYITSSMCMGDGYYCSSSAECYSGEFCCRTSHVLPGCCYKYPTPTSSTPQPTTTTTAVETSPPFFKRNLIASIDKQLRLLSNLFQLPTLFDPNILIYT